MKVMESTYGELSGVINSLSYPDGSPKSCILNEENRIQTPVGEIIPKYREAEFGERQKKHRSSLSFYPGGQLKAAALDKAMPLQTPIGEFKAEFVTFFEDGKINRLFPLNGQIDGFWSEQQEGELAEVLEFDLPVGKFSAKIISLNFYPSGALKSLTLWPGERIRIETPVGPMNVRTGFSLYENGAVRSVEPSGMAELITPIGIIQASDPEMLGMNADQNSVQFSPEGALLSLKTVHTGICVASEEGETYTNIEPHEAPSLIDIEQMRTVPMLIDFSETEITITAKEVHRFDIDTHNFQSFERKRVLRECCGGGCGGGECGGCSGGDDCCQN